MGGLPYEYPNIVVISVGVMIFFKEYVSKTRFIVRFAKPIQELSKLTFGIYLIHLLILEICYSLGVNIQILHPIISIPLLAVIVFICSGGIIWLLRKIPVVGTYFA